MASKVVTVTPGLSPFLKALKAVEGERDVERAIESLISLLKRRQIKNSRPCALATITLLSKVVELHHFISVKALLARVQAVGRRLCAAQPRELVVGNIVRRVLGLIREEAEEEGRNGMTHSSFTESQDDRTSQGFSPVVPGLVDTTASLPSALRDIHEDSERSNDSSFVSNTPASSLQTTSDSAHPFQPHLATQTSMFSLLSYVDSPSRPSTPVSTVAKPGASFSALPHRTFTSQSQPQHTMDSSNLKDDVLNGIEEILDELNQADEQIASYAPDHIHSGEVILTATASTTVQRFLLKAASQKRRFTVIYAESYPNDHEAVHAAVTRKSKTSGGPSESKDGADGISTEVFVKPLTEAGVTVILIPDSAIFALMSRVNKVVLGTHAVLANGGLVAAAGARPIAEAAKMHRTPVVVLSAVFKLSPVYPFDLEALVEYGNSGKVLPYEDGSLVDKIDVENPLFDYVPAELVDLFITNLGGHAPSYLYRIVSDHYRVEDSKI